MTGDESGSEVRALAAAVGIPLHAERVPPLAFGLNLMRNSSSTIMSFDFGRLEPAPQFRPPPNA
jgi:hypothetical protein